MPIGALASRTGTPISTLRFYERNGLLGEPPRVSGQRRYPPEAAQRVAMIRMWRRANFSVTEIRTLLADRHRLDDWQDLVRTKINELGAHVEQIQASRAELQHALFCRADDWTACSWMKAAAQPPQGLPSSTHVAPAAQAQLASGMALYGITGAFVASPGKRDQLVAHMLEAAELMVAVPGCLLYLVATTESADEVAITELWTDQAAHEASLQAPGVAELIEKARPVIAGMTGRSVLTVLGGKGLPPA